MKYKNIAISGDIGTGKTTLAKKLAEKLGWEYLSGGGLIRRWYEENNLDVSEVNKVPEDVDRKLEDDFQKRLEIDSNVVFESRMAGFLAKDSPETLRVLCTTDFNVAAERVSKREGKNVEDVKKEMTDRSKGLVEKFKRLYDAGDFLDKKYFNLVIDTTTNNADQALEIVLSKLNS